MLGLAQVSGSPISALAGQSGPTFLWTAETSITGFSGSAVTQVYNVVVGSGGLQAGGGADTHQTVRSYFGTGGIVVTGDTDYYKLREVVNYFPTGGISYAESYALTRFRHRVYLVALGVFVGGQSAITVASPAGGQAGDLELLFVESANQVITLPSGFTELSCSPMYTGTAAAAGGVRLGGYWRWWVDNTSTVSVVDTGNHTTGIRAYFRNVDQLSPFDVAPVGDVVASASTAWSLPAIQSVSEDTFIVLAIGNDLDSAQSNTALSSWSNANLTNLTQRFDQTIATGVGGGLGLAIADFPDIGSTGTTAVTSSTSVTAAMFTIVLRQANPLGSHTVPVSGGCLYTGAGSYNYTEVHLCFRRWTGTEWVVVENGLWRGASTWGSALMPPMRWWTGTEWTTRPTPY